MNTNKMIKLTTDGRNKFLLKLFNSSLCHGCYPQLFKKSQATILHKTGKSKSDVTSYRPLSLSSCLGKVL